ncbi:lipoprotein [Bordetella hinzii]|uniref:hypothetical protein n=1 Tax=Bordetella hinzii TaxID=103855 RepID=UPI00045A8820|nr:hypothetical protein [Bordetella hinzii]AKQ53689.1 hypothetical protein ACR54_00332 [Bordetella hinzii]KCB32877.1 hypothetical protein L543_0343 [Bordetella hinzii L60]SNV99418.1 lipoprotein [Bordetella hinzii]
MRKLRLLLVAIALSGLAAACVGVPGERVRWQGAVLTASADMNDNSALAVDLLLVLEPILARQLASMSAVQWFDKRAELMAAYGSELKVAGWEIVPGQQVEVSAAALPSGRAVAVYLFAHYWRQGPHRLRIVQRDGRLRLYFDSQQASVLPPR